MKMEVRKLPLSPCKKTNKQTNIPDLGFTNQIWFSIFAHDLNVNPIQDSGRQKGPLYQFFLCNFWKCKCLPLTFSFYPFSTLVWNFKYIPSASPKYLNFNQGHPLKKCFFWSNAYNIVVMITSLILMLEWPNFGHMNTSRIKFVSRDKNRLVTSWTYIMTS